LTLEQVDELYLTVGSARNSGSFVPTMKLSRDMQEKASDESVVIQHVEGDLEKLEI
jgi:hypothetical protein